MQVTDLFKQTDRLPTDGKMTWVKHENSWTYVGLRNGGAICTLIRLTPGKREKANEPYRWAMSFMGSGVYEDFTGRRDDVMIAVMQYVERMVGGKEEQ